MTYPLSLIISGNTHDGHLQTAIKLLPYLQSALYSTHHGGPLARPMPAIGRITQGLLLDSYQ